MAQPKSVPTAVVPPPSAPAYRPAALVLLMLAAAISTYLAVQSLRAGSVPGCDEGGCAVVLGSKWSKAFGVPIGLFGAAAYLLLAIFGARPFQPAQRGVRLVAHALALLIPGAAAWFVALQLWVVKAFCPWCCTTHGLATAGAVLMLLTWRRDTAAPASAGARRKGASSTKSLLPPVWPAAAGLGAAALAGLVVVQALGPEPANARAVRATLDAPTNTAPAGSALSSTSNPPVSATAVAAPATNTGPASPGSRFLALHDGKFQLDPWELPILGATNAAHFVVMISDYTCKFCRATHGLLGDVREAFAESELAFLMLPSHHGGDSLAIQELMLATWRLDRAVWQRVADELYHERLQLKPEAVRAALDQQLGAGRLAPALSAQRAWTTNLFGLSRAIAAANKAKTGSGNIPQLVVGREIVVGAPEGSGEIFQLLEKSFGLSRKRLPELTLGTPVVELGRVFAGTTRTFALPYTNTGQATLQLSSARMPPGGKVGKGLLTPVAPGAGAQVELTFSVPREEGPFDESVMLHSNARDSARELRIQGTAWKPIRITPETLDFGKVDADSSSTQAVMRVELLEPVRIESVRSQNPGFQAILTEVEAQRTYEVQVGTTPSLGAGRQQAVIRLSFAKPVPAGWPETVALAARIEVDRAVSVVPPRLTIPAGTLTSTRHHQVLVRCSDGSPDFAVTGAVLEGGPAFTQPQIQKSTGTDHIVVVSLPAGWTPPTPPSGARLVIHTSHARYPILEVPLVTQP